MTLLLTKRAKKEEDFFFSRPPSIKTGYLWVLLLVLQICPLAWREFLPGRIPRVAALPCDVFSPLQAAAAVDPFVSLRHRR
jgi:hypothetical protein